MPLLLKRQRRYRGKSRTSYNKAILLIKINLHKLVKQFFNYKRENKSIKSHQSNEYHHTTTIYIEEDGVHLITKHIETISNIYTLFQKSLKQ